MPNNLRQSPVQLALFALGGVILVYAIAVLVYASTSYEIGIRSILTPHIIGKARSETKAENSEELSSGDKIVKIGDLKIRTWSDLLQAPRRIANRLAADAEPSSWWKQDPASGQTFVRVEFQRGSIGPAYHTWCELRRIPFEEMIPSILWLFLKGSLFVVGAFVYWKRPTDESAQRFYLLCVVTVGAYIGGYHWGPALGGTGL